MMRLKEKVCILDFEDFCLCFSEDNYLRRPSSRGSVLFPRGPLLGGLRLRSLCDRLHLVDSHGKWGAPPHIV